MMLGIMDFELVHVSFRTSAVERDRLREEAERLGMNVTELIKKSVDRFVESQEEGGAVFKSA